MGLKKFIKKAVQPILKISAAPLSIPLGVINKAGLSETVKSITSVDTQNLENVINNTTKLQGSTGSDEFKSAAFDGVKIGAAALGGGGAISATAAGGTFLAASKAQAGGGLSLGDLGGIAGLPTNFGGFDVGGFDIVKPKKIQQIVENFPEYFEDQYQQITAPENRTVLYSVIGVIGLIASIFLIRKIVK